MNNESQMKSALVLAFQPGLRTGMATMLKEAGFKVDTMSSSVDAREMVVEAGYDIIVADEHGARSNDLNFFEFARQRTNARLLLAITEPTRETTSDRAKKFSADRAVCVPFGKQEFMREVEAALGMKSRGKHAYSADEYRAIPIDAFLSGSTLEVDLHVKLGHRVVKVGTRGSIIDSSRVRAYSERGLSSFYITRPDYQIYAQFAFRLAERVLDEDSTLTARGVTVCRRAIETALQRLDAKGMAREDLGVIAQLILRVVDIAAKNPSVLSLIKAQNGHAEEAAHAFEMAVWSCLIARKFGWRSTLTLHKVALAALFHDIGKSQLPEEALGAARDAHTLMGEKVLRSVPGLSEDFAIVALQHHEVFRGGGAPFGLRGEQIHPLARLIGLADRFVDTLKKSQVTGEVVLDEAIRELSLMQMDFDPLMLQALQALVSVLQHARESERLPAGA